MSLRRSSCRSLSWLLRAGKVRMGPPRLSLPPANKHMRTIRHQGEDAAPEARRRPASPPPAQPKRPSRGQCPRSTGTSGRATRTGRVSQNPVSFLQGVCFLPSSVLWLERKRVTFTCFLCLKLHLLTPPLCLLPSVSLHLFVSLSLFLCLSLLQHFEYSLPDILSVLFTTNQTALNLNRKKTGLFTKLCG